MNQQEPVATFTQKHRGRIVHVSKFGLVGIANTLVDFTLYNFLSSFAGLSLLQANAVSTTIAMGFSFVAQKKVVFKHQRSGSLLKQTIIFFGVTAFGLYVLQTGTIKLLTDLWLTPVALMLWLAHLVNITGHDQFLIKNFAKAAGTLVSLTWNYIMYKKVVFS